MRPPLHSAMACRRSSLRAPFVWSRCHRRTWPSRSAGDCRASSASRSIQVSSGAHTLGACRQFLGRVSLWARGFWPVCGVGTLPGSPPLAIEIRPFPISLTRDLLLATCGGIFMSSPRYHPQKETLCGAKGNTFFMQKMSNHLYRRNPSNLFPISNIMFPRILESPKRFSPPPGAGAGHDSVRVGSTRRTPVPRPISGDGGR